MRNLITLSSIFLFAACGGDDEAPGDAEPVVVATFDGAAFQLPESLALRDGSPT